MAEHDWLNQFFRDASAAGEKSRCARLTDDDVYAIRHLYDAAPRSRAGRVQGLQSIAERFRISRSHVSAIGLRKFWSHLPEQSWDEGDDDTD